MKKQFTNILRLFLIMILAGLTASCSFWSDSIEEHEESPEACVSADSADSKWTFTVNGKISIKEGAFPSSILNTSKGKRASRSAMPEIPTGLTCSITAISGSNTQTATTSDNKNYTLVLEGGKAWTVTAVLNNSEGNPVLSDTWPISASNTETNLSHNFWVRPAASNGGSGKVELTITINNELKNTISRVSTSCKSSNDENWEASITPDDITFGESDPAEIVIRQNSIPSGVYEVSINFYNSENVLVYNTIQSINVFDNLTTNTWVAGTTSGPIKSNGTFELTKSLIDGYSKTHLYVGETHFGTAKADDASGTGSAAKPFQSVTGAINYLKKVGSSGKDYTIYVVGTVDGAQIIEDTDSSTPIPASSITLEGFYGLDDNDVPQDVLDGGLDEDNNGQTLLISTSIPVTIKNLTITGGYQFNNYGAGISVSGDSKVYLEDGTLITGNHSEAAGAAIGIYDNATVTMNGGVIENNASQYEFEGTDFSGTVIIFKEDRNEAGTPKFIMNGGTIKKNTTFFYGGGVGVALDGVFEMNGGTIGGTSEEDANIADTDGTSSENARSTYGGGVYVGDGGSFVMTGGLIANNKATGIGTDPQENHQYMNCGGGGVAVCEGGSFEMKAGETTTGTISSNTSARNGGGVYIDSENSTFKMTAGTISGNTSTDEGKGVYLNSSSSVFKMGYTAIVQPDGTGANDVYLPDGATITIIEAFDGNIGCAAKITPAEYDPDTTVLSAEGVNLAYEYMVFAVTPQVTGETPNEVTTNWYITSEGKLTTTDPNGSGGNGGNSSSPEYVDLGLPSGTLWANMNVGAASVTDPGTNFYWSVDCSNENISANYHNTGDTLLPADDHATVEWGSDWVTPTTEQIQELYDNCYFEPVTSYNGKTINGYVVYLAKNTEHTHLVEQNNAFVGTMSEYIKDGYSDSDPHIFLPAINGNEVWMWSSTFRGKPGTDYVADVFGLSSQWYEIIETTQVEFMEYPVRPVSVRTGGFVYVEGATITTPSENFYGGGAFAYASTSNRVVVPSFYMCNHEVTQGEYEKYCFYGGTAPSETTDKYNYPAYNISWYDAIVYCNLRSIAEHLTPVYSVKKSGDTTEKSTNPAEWDGIRTQGSGKNIKYCGPDETNYAWDWVADYPGYESIDVNPTANGYRLPSNVEWEYAARGGNGLSRPQTEFSGSGTYSDIGFEDFNIHKIKQKLANYLGIYDMSGSVAEWFFDIYGEDFRGISPNTDQDAIDYSNGVEPFERSKNSDIKQGLRVIHY